MNKPPRISIVMSVFNNADSVERAIVSIRNQTFSDFEFVAINDGSTDGTGEILQRISAGDSRLRILDQANTGLTKALIRGCAVARGTYIARQDADDFSEPTRLEKQVDFLDRNPDVGFVSCSTRYIGPRDEILNVVTRPSDPYAATHGLLHERLGPPAHGSVMFRKSVYDHVGGYRPEFYFGQDSDLWMRMAGHTRIGYVSEVLYSFRWHSGSITGSSRELQKRFGELGQACNSARLNGAPEEPFFDEARQLSEQIRTGKIPKTSSGSSELEMAYLIGSQLAGIGDSRACGYLWQVLRQQPWYWKAWVRLGQSFLCRATSNSQTERSAVSWMNADR